MLLQKCYGFSNLQFESCFHGFDFILKYSCTLIYLYSHFSSCSTIAAYIWGVIALIGFVIVYRSLCVGQYEMAYISALFAFNDAGSVTIDPVLHLFLCISW